MSATLLVTPRLELCYPEPEDFSTLSAVLTDPDVMKMAFGGQAMTQEGAHAFFASALDWHRNGRNPGVLREKASGRVIGLAGLKACTALGGQDYELGFVLARECWGKGYATEIGRAQLAYGFAALGCTRMLGLVAPDNAASRHALMKIGLAYHSTIMTTERGAREVFTASPGQA